MISYGRQTIGQDDIDSVVNVLRADWLTQGPMVPQFEMSVAKYCGVSYGVAVNSATSALHIACLSLGLTQGDCLWTTPISFVASANCALYCGASVDFVDIENDTFNMDMEALSTKLFFAKRNNLLPKIVLVVHFAGQSADMAALKKLANEYNFKIIEDASHAMGSRHKGHLVGSCEFSDITVFSFHPVKIITTGEGGMAMTNNIKILKKMQMFRSHGITKCKDDFFSTAINCDWYYEQQELGFNYRMTDIQAALGISQVKKIDKFLSSRNDIASRYQAQLNSTPLLLPKVLNENFSAYHLYVVRINQERPQIARQKLYESLRANGINCNLHYIPIYRHPFYKRFNYNVQLFPNAEAYYDSALSLPIYPTLAALEQEKVVGVIKEELSA
jgi:UDP-4-amino-4,6-dideoxy-N-acetyl-beta-L-altrosamine transaminase